MLHRRAQPEKLKPQWWT